MDDLDAFFDEVDTAVKEVEEKEDSEAAADATKQPAAKPSASAAADEERPAKRAKVAASSAPVKNLVASSVPVISIAPPLPPGPPPSAASSAIPPPPPPASLNASILSNPDAPHPPPPPPLPPAAQTNPNAKPNVRSAAGETWTDPTLAQWPENDFRLFVGNLAKDLKQHHLEQHFGKYPSFAMARIMYNKADGKSRGYGFVSVLDPKDCAKAIREMDQSWLGSRPIKVKLSEWKDREWKEVKKRGKMEKRKKRHTLATGSREL
ncbi:hypothetical protein ACHAXT_003828 [Thalassiosira profunda]